MKWSIHSFEGKLISNYFENRLTSECRECVSMFLWVVSFTTVMLYISMQSFQVTILICLCDTTGLMSNNTIVHCHIQLTYWVLHGQDDEESHDRVNYGLEMSVTVISCLHIAEPSGITSPDQKIAVSALLKTNAVLRNITKLNLKLEAFGRKKICFPTQKLSCHLKTVAIV